jgi:hypothetical protein
MRKLCANFVLKRLSIDVYNCFIKRISWIFCWDEKKISIWQHTHFYCFSGAVVRVINTCKLTRWDLDGNGNLEKAIIGTIYLFGLVG